MNPTAAWRRRVHPRVEASPMAERSPFDRSGRLDPAVAPVILGLVDRAAASMPPDAPGLSALHLVRGDALRHLGRESDAVAAYQLDHQALAGGEVAKEVS